MFNTTVASAVLLAASLASTQADAQMVKRGPLVVGRSSPPAITASEPTTLAKLREALSHRAAPQAGTAHTLSYPYGLAVDVNGNLYVTQIFGGVNVYNVKHVLTASITSNVSYPSGVGVSFNGNVYVANEGTSNVTVYAAGSYAQIGTIADSSLTSPVSLYVDVDDTAWVLDQTGNVHGYMSDGTVLTPRYTGGTVLGPWGPAVTVWGIVDPNGGWDERYELRSSAVRYGPSFDFGFSGLPNTGGEAQDQFGQQYLTDITYNQVQIWGANGTTFVTRVNLPATGYGVAVDPLRGRFYVALPHLNEVVCYATASPYKPCGVIK